jgi:hypothetical protein
VIHVVTPRDRGGTVDTVSVRPWGRAIVKRYRGGAIRRFLQGAAAFVASMLGREANDPKSTLSKEESAELESWEAFEALTALTRNFNGEAGALTASSDGPKLTAKSVDDLFAVPTPAPGVDAAAAREFATARAARWCRLYAIADVLAQRRRDEFKRDWLFVYGLALFAFLCFGLFSLAESASNLILVLYSLTFVAIFFVFIRSLLRGHQIRFLDYRALAEALRVAVYWKLAGVGAHQGAASDATLGALADAYPIKQPNELAWVKISLRMLELV